MARAIILCYHKVGSESEEGRRLNISPERLESHVRFFHRRQLPIRRASDLIAPWPDKCVCFTFDDAYISAVDRASTILEAYDARGSFYAVSELVGTRSSWDGEQGRPLADWDALRDLAQRGHEIGNHTSHHQRLGDLEPALAQQGAIQSARNRFDREQLPTVTFCYPYGSVGDTLAVKSAGYEIGLALDKRIATTADNRLRLPRIVVAFSDSLPGLLYRIYVRAALRRH